MKKKLWAFSLGLAISILTLIVPPQPVVWLQFHPGSRLAQSGDNTIRAERQQAMAQMTGQKLRPTGWWTGACGEDLLTEERLNCAINFLNHPGLWLSR